MADYFEQNRDAVILGLQKYPATSALDPTVVGTLEEALVGGFADAANGLQNSLDKVLASIQAERAAAKPDTAAYIVERIKNVWQNGDLLTLVDNIPTYAVIDPSKRIAQYAAAISDTPGFVTIKAAKDDNGSPIPLSSSERSSLEGFVDNVLSTSIAFEVISQVADQVTISVDAEYDATVAQATFTANLQAAAETYLSNIDFAGNFEQRRLENDFEGVTGFLGIESITISITDYLGNTYNTPAQLRRLRLASGYAALQNIIVNPIAL